LRSSVSQAWSRSAPRRLPRLDTRELERLSAARDGGTAAGLGSSRLLSPPSKKYNNKILWASHESTVPGSDLQISAQRMIGSRPLGAPVSRRVMGGPGPSIIDLPVAGCWRLRLRRSGRTDTIDLRYVADR
jgi:hypothetical protein